MAENIYSETNTHDVALELLKLHIDRVAIEAEELSELYTKYFSLAKSLERAKTEYLHDFLPEEIKRAI